MPHYDSEHLHSLGLTQQDMNGLSEDHQLTKIKKAYRTLALTCHPDKVGDVGKDKFVKIIAAYEALINIIVSDDPSSSKAHEYPFDRYFKKTSLSVPITGFDQFMTEQILAAFNGLLREFDTLATEYEKQQFADYYGPFIEIAERLEEEKHQRMNARVKSFNYVMQEEGLQDYLLRETRKLAIRLFAEEGLDDFSYREFEAFGFDSAKPLFTIRKLLSPLKWIAAILGALDLLTRGTVDYYLVHDNLQLAQVAHWFTAPFFAAHFVSELLASPINQISRPLSELTGLPPLVFTSLMAVIASSVMYELLTGAMTLSLTSAMLFVPYVNIATSLYSLYCSYQMIQLGEKTGRDLLSTALIFAMIPLVSLLPGSETPFLQLMLNLGNLCTLKKLYSHFAVSVENYPIAEEAVSEEVREATGKGYKIAHQSHLFFNTPEDALCENDPSFLQKTASFFGVNRSTHQEPKPWASNSAARGLSA